MSEPGGEFVAVSEGATSAVVPSADGPPTASGAEVSLGVAPDAAPPRRAGAVPAEVADSDAEPTPDDDGVADLLARARAGSPRALGRLLTSVEGPASASVRDALRGESASALVIGVTGPPGAGKSTTISALVGAYRQRGLRVAVLAVDPSSPYSGGALLGDRIRMDRHIDDPGVFIRSLAARGHLGGLSEAVPAALALLAAVGYEVVLLETVGVGQSEIEIAAVADPTLVVLNPGAGDAIQAAKAGLLEVADILVVNKADRDGAQQTVRDLRAEASVPILTLIADRGVGVGELITAIDAHRRAETRDRRTARARAQILSLAQSRLRGHSDLDRLADAVGAGALDAYSAADTLLSTPAHRCLDTGTNPSPSR